MLTPCSCCRQTVFPISTPATRKVDTLSGPIFGERMLHTREIIKKIWDAQGYGNLAVWGDGTTLIIAPGESPLHDGEPPLAIFKPIPLVAGFSLLGLATHNADLLQHIEKTIREAGGEIVRD